MNKISTFTFLALVAIVAAGAPQALAQRTGLTSFDTGYTITKIRAATTDGQTHIVASSYEGTVLSISYEGNILWEHSLSGYMNHDLWCADLNQDGTDEVLTANADGSVYCLSSTGEMLWSFKVNDAPMYTVCAIKHEGRNFVACGGYDKNVYYLSAKGQLLFTLPAASYSHEPAIASDGKANPPNNTHTANFVRPFTHTDGSQSLVIHGVVHTMNAQAQGSLYFFKPLEKQPHQVIEITKGRVFGDLRVRDVDGDGDQEILMGTSTMIHQAAVVRIDPQENKQVSLPIRKIQGNMDHFGYRVVQPEVIDHDQHPELVVFFGSRVLSASASLDINQCKVQANQYSFNDLWRDSARGVLLAASIQSGGSCVHIIDPSQPNWQQALASMQPLGKMAAINTNTATARKQLEGFTAPSWERSPLPVYFLSESARSVQAHASEILTRHKSPVFLRGLWPGGGENWDRSAMTNKKYRERRDARWKYDMTQEQALARIIPGFDDWPGVAYWGGHGNDPYKFQIDTTKKVIDAAHGKMTVLIYPELEDFNPSFSFVLDDLIYPLAEYSRNKNAKLFIRSKHTFWQSTAHLPMWSRLMSGEFADVFVPAMEETSDKTMELSIAARLGVWTSGATDSWGARCARDNPSFDRMRQHSHQMVPNHFLRTMIYNISCGAQYLDNFAVDQQYMSLLWELIAKGALYVPKREEIVSFSPVHLSMIDVDPDYLDDGNNVKSTTFFDETAATKPFVFSRLNGTWPAAPVTQWDFSRYAAGVKDRRLNFLPPYPHGLVMITPPQQGKPADTGIPRKKMVDQLHPIYKNIMQEHYTDGRLYYSADGQETHNADDYYKRIEKDIRQAATQIPLTVEGEVAWVTAQTSPTHLRLTMIDGGYLNPDNRTVTVHFHTVQPAKITDLLSGETFKAADTTTIQIPCGGFRFLDIQLTQPFPDEHQSNSP